MPHIHEKIDFTVNVYIVFNDKVLLRKHDKYDMWLPPGGHIELEEDPNEAAVREAWEETGLKVKLLDTRSYFEENENYKELIPPMALNKHKINATHAHVSLEYVALTTNNNVDPQENGDASYEWKWYSIEQLERASEIKKEVKHDAVKAIEKVKQHHGI